MHTRNPTVLLRVVCIGVLLWGQVNFLHGQQRSTFLRGSNAPVFIPAPRELTRELDRAVQDIAAEQYVDALARIDFVLNGAREQSSEFAQDYFLPTEKDGTQKSLLTAAELLIRDLPEAGQQAYELAYGTEASKQLEQAITNNDYDAITAISRRYGATRAGEEATLLLARRQLGQGKPFESIQFLRRLRNSPRAAERFGAEVDLLYAAALKLSRRNRLMKEVITAIDSAEWARLGIDRSRWLAESPSPIDQREFVRDWHWSGGNLARNGIFNASLPMRTVAWQNPNMVGSGNEVLADLAKGRRSRGDLPTVTPLLVGDSILFRGPSQLFGASMRRQLYRAWDYPSPDETEQLSEGRRESLMEKRLWENWLHGQLSSDGQNVYVISDGDKSVSPQTASSNKLVALNLQAEGKLKWIVGGDDDQDEPALLGTFFLCTPLPIGDSLYCVGERNGEIRLLELEKSSGRLLWSQQLAHVETLFRYGRPDARRYSGLQLSYADGILVCPTSTGGVIGIDLAQKRFAWGFQYEQQVNQLVRRGAVRPPQQSTWKANGAVLDRGRVFLTLWNAKELYCLDLLTGELKWKSPHDKGLFLGGVHEDRLIVVSENEVTAKDVKDGKAVWRRPLRGGPSGRGIQTTTHYMLATTDSELVQINLSTGEIDESMQTVEPLGNLIASDEMIISQNSLALRTFYQKDKLLRKIERSLAENPRDPWALEHAGYVLLEQGKRDEGLEKLQLAIAEYPKLETPGIEHFAQERLVDEVFEMLLREDRPEALALAEKIQPAIPSSRQSEYLRVMTVRNLKAGRLQEAFESNLRLFLASLEDTSRTLVEPPMMEFSDREIQPARWHRSMFQAIWKRADTAQRDLLGKLLLSRVETMDERYQDAVAEVAQDIPPMHPRYLDLIGDKLASTSRVPYVEGPLLRLVRSENPRIAARAAAELAQLYYLTGQMTAAAEQYRRLDTEFAGQTLSSGLTGKAIAEKALNENAALAAYYDFHEAMAPAAKTPSPWGFGKLERKQEPQEPRRQRLPNMYGRRNVDAIGTTELLGTDHGRYLNDQMRWVVSKYQGCPLEIRDSMGQTLKSLGTTFASARKGQEPKVRTFGHLAVAAFDNSIVAFDGLRDTTTSTNTELWRDTRASTMIRGANPTGILRFGQVGLSRQVESGPPGRNALCLASVSDRGVIFRRGGDLICSDPATGDLLWKRDDLRVEAELWGDDEYVFAHVEARHGGGKARVFSVLDGSELEPRAVPDRANRVRTYGRYVLSWQRDVETNSGSEPGSESTSNSSAEPTSKDDEKTSVRNFFELRDLFQETSDPLWSRNYSNQARAVWLSYDQLALYDPESEHLEVISILDGKNLLRVPIKTSLRQVDSLWVKKQSGLFVIALGQNSDGRVNGRITFRSPIAAKPLQRLEVYGFSTTGEMVWGVPAKLLNFRLLPTQQDAIPLLAFGRRNEASGNRSKRLLETVLLDVRDGHVALQSSELLDSSGSFRLSGQVGQSDVELLLPSENGKWTLNFTDKPRAPSVPYGYATDQTRKGNAKFSIGAFFDSLLPSTDIPQP